MSFINTPTGQRRFEDNYSSVQKISPRRHMFSEKQVEEEN
jgi:hypothetical protein